MTECYAVVVHGAIKTATLFGHARGAMVNGLVTIFDVKPLDSWSDAKIKEVWTRLSAGYDIRIAKFKLEEIPILPDEV